MKVATGMQAASNRCFKLAWTKRAFHQYAKKEGEEISHYRKRIPAGKTAAEKAERQKLKTLHEKTSEGKN